MSCLKLCDSEDCYNTDNDTFIHHIDYDTTQFLLEHCKSWFRSYAIEDICQECIDSINADYSEFFILDNSNKLSIGKKYINNPKLLE